MTSRTRVRPYLELVRPGNVATALADVLAGVAVAGPESYVSLPWLLVSTACLYGGGITLNDYFDRHTDALERPERAIPSGRIPAGRAAGFGAVLLALGVAAAAAVSPTAAMVAALIVLAVMLYDTWGKHRMFIGPVNMGLCRGLNVLLGVSAAPARLVTHWPLGLIGLTYISAVTAVSRGEVSGGKRPVAAMALALIACVFAALAWIALAADDLARTVPALLYLAVLTWRVWPPFLQAYRTPQPGPIRSAIRAGVLSLVFVDAVIAAAYAGMIYSLGVLATAVLAGWLARRFAVT